MSEGSAWIPEANKEKWFDFKLVLRRHSFKPETAEEKAAAKGDIHCL